MKLLVLLSLLVSNGFAFPPDTVKQEEKKKPAATAPAAKPPAPKPKKAKPSGPVLPSILIVDF